MARVSTRLDKAAKTPIRSRHPARAAKQGQRTWQSARVGGSRRKPSRRRRRRAGRRARRRKPAGGNPLLEPWTTPFAMPPFDRIAWSTSCRRSTAALPSTARRSRRSPTTRRRRPSPTPSTRWSVPATRSTASRPCSSISPPPTPTPEIQAIERALAPRFAKHGMRIYQDATLFARVDALFKKRKKLKLSQEQTRVLERYHRAFVKSGAGLEPKAKKRMAAIAQRMSVLGTNFSQNLLADEQAFVLVLEGEADLAGLPEAVRAAAAQTAKDHGHPGKHAITLARSSDRAVPAVFGPARSAREGVQGLDHARRQRRQDRQPQDRGRDPGAAGRARAPARLQDGGRLRARVLHGQDAGRRAQAADGGVAAGAGARGRGARPAAGGRARPRAATSSSRPGTGATTPRRCARPSSTSTRPRSSPTCSSTTSSPRPSTCAAKLFGVTFTERTDLPVYHPDVRAFEVKRDGRARRPLPRRLFRQAVEALGRLDVGLAQAGEARRRHHARSSSTS